MRKHDPSARGKRFATGPLAATVIALVLLFATFCSRSDPAHEASDGSAAGDAPVASDAVVEGETGAVAVDSHPAPDDGASEDVSVSIEPAADPPANPAVLTFRNDNFRTGAYLLERQLDVAGVRGRGMALKFSNTIKGRVNAQPLYVPGLNVKGKARDVVFLATLGNNLYAFDANEAAPSPAMTSTKLWEVTLTDPENATARPLARGIYSTPVIDLPSNTMYLVYSTRNTPLDTGKLTAAETAALDVEFFLVAIDIRDGTQLRTRKLEGSYPRSDGSPVLFEARNHWCRPALLLSRGSLYVACGMRNHENATLFRGWVFRHDAATLARQATFCTAPDVTLPGEGASIWQSGSGIAEDREGNLYFITGNGPADLKNRSYGNALVKLSTTDGSLSVAGAFTSEGPEGRLAKHDVDFGSGGALVLPDAPYVLGAGKTGIGYLLARDSMEKKQEFAAAVNQYDPMAPVDRFWAGGPHLHGTPAYWRGPTEGTAYVYTWGEQDYLRRHVFDLAAGQFEPSKGLAGKLLAFDKTMPGGTLSLSADGNRAGTGIVWATLPAFPESDPRSNGRLLAYDAETLELLWETTFSSLPKWMPPTIADGKVFLGTSSDKFLVYELGPPKP